MNQYKNKKYLVACLPFPTTVKTTFGKSTRGFYMF